jgi:hypothetical protein
MEVVVVVSVGVDSAIGSVREAILFFGWLIVNLNWNAAAQQVSHRKKRIFSILVRVGLPDRLFSFFLHI